MPFYVEHTKTNVFICDHCGIKAEFQLEHNRDVRKHGWAISKDYSKCYCPNCKHIYTSVGCMGKASWRSMK